MKEHKKNTDLLRVNKKSILFNNFATLLGVALGAAVDRYNYGTEEIRKIIE